jgi:hypothetical protein
MNKTFEMAIVWCRIASKDDAVSIHLNYESSKR